LCEHVRDLRAVHHGAGHVSCYGADHQACGRILDDPFQGVALRDVLDLMSNDPGQLFGRAGLLKQAAEYDDVSSGSANALIMETSPHIP
jgi:hypothetical protein